MKNKIINGLLGWLGVFALIGIVYFLFWVDFKLWRMEHPSTPTWVYWVKSK